MVAGMSDDAPSLDELFFHDLGSTEAPPRVAVGGFKVDGRWHYFEVYEDSGTRFMPARRPQKKDPEFTLTEAMRAQLHAAYCAWRRGPDAAGPEPAPDHGTVARAEAFRRSRRGAVGRIKTFFGH
jgi:hypothetical protein